MTWQGTSSGSESAVEPALAVLAPMLWLSERIVRHGSVCYNARRWRDERRAAVQRCVVWPGRSPEFWSGV